MWIIETEKIWLTATILSSLNSVLRFTYVPINMLFSKASLAVITASILLLLTAHTKTHSYSNCIDWRFNSQEQVAGNSNGNCADYARQFPLDAKKLPSSVLMTPIATTNSCTMTLAKPPLLERPLGNHAVPGENDLSTINFGISDVNLTEDPSQEYFNKHIIAHLDYKNGTKNGSTDTWPCGGHFNIPTSVMPGHHVRNGAGDSTRRSGTSWADLDVKAK
ncbi:hypothetical protein BG000_009273 [Podila horticola]|nr:hypothetical protein BG000_009273 [Podila horticola]